MAKIDKEYLKEYYTEEDWYSIIGEEDTQEYSCISIEQLKEMVTAGELNQDQVEFFNKCIEFLTS